MSIRRGLNHGVVRAIRHGLAISAVVWAGQTIGAPLIAVAGPADEHALVAADMRDRGPTSIPPVPIPAPNPDSNRDSISALILSPIPSPIDSVSAGGPTASVDPLQQAFETIARFANPGSGSESRGADGAHGVDGGDGRDGADGVESTSNPATGSALPDRALGPTSVPPGTWTRHACADCIASIAAGPDAVWAGTMSGGIVRWTPDGRSFRRWTKADGLPNEFVTAIAPAPDGTVWAVIGGRQVLARAETLAHFNGTVWTEIPLPVWLEGNIGPTRRAAAAEGDGVWVASSVGLGYYDGRRWTQTSAADGSLPDDGVRDVVLAPDGVLWVATAAGLATRAPDGSWSTIPSDTGLPYETTVVHIAPGGDVWVGISDGVMRLSGDTWTVHTVADGLRSAAVTGIGSSGDGRVWVAHRNEEGVSVWDGSTWSGAGIADGLPAVSIERLESGPDGALWATTFDSGLGRFDDRIWSTVLSGAGPPKVFTFDIEVASGKPAWFAHFGMDSGDSTRYRSTFEGAWTDYAPEDGLPPIEMSLSSAGTDGAIDPEGGYWWPAMLDPDYERPGLLRFDGVTATSFEGDDHPPGSRVDDLHYSHSSKLLIAVNDEGVHYRSDGPWESLDVTALPSKSLTAVAGDVGVIFAVFCWIDRGLEDCIRHPNNTWVGGRDFVAQYKSGTIWTVHAAGDGSGYPAGVVQDITGMKSDLWVLMEDGTVARLNDDGWSSWPPSEVLGGAALFESSYANAIATDDRGGVWIGVSGDGADGVGAAYFDGTTWSQIRPSDGLADSVIYDIEVERSGRVWFAGLTAIGTFDPEPIPDPTTPTTPTDPTDPPGTCICQSTRDIVPAAVVTSALANPASISGWGQPRDPGKPVSPFNPLRECLVMRNSAVPYHPLYNSLVWSAGCR